MAAMSHGKLQPFHACFHHHWQPCMHLSTLSRLLLLIIASSCMQTAAISCTPQFPHQTLLPEGLSVLIALGLLPVLAADMLPMCCTEYVHVPQRHRQMSSGFHKLHEITPCCELLLSYADQLKHLFSH